MPEENHHGSPPANFFPCSSQILGWITLNSFMYIPIIKSASYYFTIPCIHRAILGHDMNERSPRNKRFMLKKLSLQGQAMVFLKSLFVYAVRIKFDRRPLFIDSFRRQRRSYVKFAFIHFARL